MCEQMIDYLLGLLDDAERAAFETLLATDGRLSAELEMLQRPLSWLAEDADSIIPPPDLVERTCRRLTIYLRSDNPPLSS